MKTKPTKAKKKAKNPPMTPSALLAQAENLLHTGRPGEALPLATQALTILQPAPQNPTPASLPALALLAEINLELGSPSTARAHFLAAVALDPDGSTPASDGGGAEKFFWLAQLSEDGGRDSVDWFEKGAEALRREIMRTVGGDDDDGDKEAGDAVEGMMKRLASALCGIVEIYMTDLSSVPTFPHLYIQTTYAAADRNVMPRSWDPNAETHCENLIAEALLSAPHAPEPLQTLASIRISQSRLSEAKTALADSMALWKDLPPDDGSVPDFATRVSLARLLMEVEMEEDALLVVERLVGEDDRSVEAWYLGGWCLFLLGQKRRNGMDGHGVKNGDEREELYTASLVSSREWLRQSLSLYEMLEYEDERLRDHAVELVERLGGELKGCDVDGAEEGDVDGAEEGDVDLWSEESEDGDGDGDEEMDGA